MGEQPTEEIQEPQAIQAPQVIQAIQAIQAVQGPRAMSPVPEGLLENRALPVIQAPGVLSPAPEDPLENKAYLVQPVIQGVRAIRASPAGMEEMACQGFRAFRVSGDIQALQEDRALFLDRRAPQEPLGSGGRPAREAREENGGCLGTGETQDTPALQEDRVLFLDRLGPKAREDYRASGAYQENGANVGTEERLARGDMRGPPGLGAREFPEEMVGMGCRDCPGRQGPLGRRDARGLPVD
jgi:hypothetical protein